MPYWATNIIVAATLGAWFPRTVPVTPIRFLQTNLLDLPTGGHPDG